LPGGVFFQKAMSHITIEWYRPYFAARCSINVQKSDANHFFEEIRFNLWFVVIGAVCTAQFKKTRSQGHDAWRRERSRLERMGEVVMLEEFTSAAIHDCYRRATEARRIAEAATNPDTKSDFLQFERRWLALAGGFSSECSANNPDFAVGW